MAMNSETEINLKTLQRVDSNIIEIIDNASQVAIYKYEKKLNKWEGTDIEGTLFLYKRCLHPSHGFIIVNRMNTTNFVETITSDMEFVLQKPYFLYKKNCGKIIGSWFYEDRDFKRITNKIQSIVLKQSPTSKRQRCSSDSDSRLKKDETVQDIMTLLYDAHNEYDKTETNLVERNNKEDFNNLITYTDKKMSNKSFSTLDKKIKTSCVRSSSEEKYPFSPRRRFLSTGSYDSTNTQLQISNKILNMIICNSDNLGISSNIGKLLPKQDEIHHSGSTDLISSSENIENVSAPTRLSPLYSPEGISSPMVTANNIFKDPIKSQNFDVSNKMSLRQSIISDTIQEVVLTDHIPKIVNEVDKTKYNSSDLKQMLISHVENDSEIMLKIHEAYAASLKSLFIQKN